MPHSYRRSVARIWSPGSRFLLPVSPGHPPLRRPGIAKGFFWISYSQIWVCFFWPMMYISCRFREKHGFRFFFWEDPSSPLWWSHPQGPVPVPVRRVEALFLRKAACCWSFKETQWNPVLQVAGEVRQKNKWKRWFRWLKKLHNSYEPWKSCPSLTRKMSTSRQSEDKLLP